MSEQQAEYEERIRRSDLERQRTEEASKVESGERERAIQQHEGRIRDLETALADKQRLLDDVSSQLVELQGAFSKLTQSEKSRIVAKSERERQLDRQLDDLAGQFRAALDAEASSGLVGIAKEKEDLILVFRDGSLFGRGSSRLDAAASGRLSRLAGALVKAKDVLLEIDAHTDSVEPKKGKLRDTWALTSQQGIAIVRELQKGGVDPSRLRFRARGRYGPRAGNDTAEGRAENRRIEVRLRPKAGP